MSIFFDFDIPLTGRRFRRAVDEDKSDIELFWKRKETESLFVAEDIGALIELATLSICLIDEDMVVQGFMALSDYPPLPGVDPAAWEYWMRNMFQKYYLSRNTLFIHFMCCKDEVAEYFLEEALISVFMNDFYLQQIILVVPPFCTFDCTAKYPTFRRRTVYKYCTKITDDMDNCISLFVAARQDFCPKLRARKAVEVDNDEIVEILDCTCEKLKEMYGEFYISEILSRHLESKRTIIVAETALHTTERGVVGVMCLNQDVDYASLQHTYELEPFHGLLQTPPMEREQIRLKNELLKTFGDPIMSGKLSPFEKIRSERIKLHSYTEDNSSKSSYSNKTNKLQHRKQHPLHKRNDSGRVSGESFKFVANPLNSDRSLLFLMDDEPLDYDIVNIDTNQLFTLHEVPSVSTQTHFKFPNVGNELKKGESSVRDVTKKKELICKGKPNAFSIELFGMRQDMDDRHAFDLLEGAFDCLPVYDYCIIRVPTSQKSFSILQYFSFVPTKQKVCSDYALYVAHRSSVHGRLRTREAEFADIPQITMLMNDLDGKETVTTIEHGLVYNKRHSTYVLLCGTSIIGFGILDPPEHIDFVRTKFVSDIFQRRKYHMERYGHESGMAMVKTVLAYPAFEPHFPFFAREMMRLSGSSTLIWLNAYRSKWVAHKANMLATVMTPLPYRVTGDSSLLPDLKDVHNLSKNLISFSAWLTSKKLTSITRLNVDTRIVVVGASKTAMCFLYSLIFSDTATYLTFTNVTLVSTHGLPYLRNSMLAAEMMFNKSQTMSDRFLKSTPFTYYVNVVHGTMVSIDRQDKFIVMENGSKLNYDMLFLLIGKQYQHPEYMSSLMERDKLIKADKIPEYVRMDSPNYIEKQQEPSVEFDTPANVFFINTIHDASNALNAVKGYFRQCADLNVCVYGSSYDAYCCLTGLLQAHISPENITFVEPLGNATKTHLPVFCNTKVDETVREIIDSHGISRYSGYYFESWTVDDTDMVTSVQFVSYHNWLKVNCSALFYYGKKGVNPYAFIAINKCGLAYDGGILIDHKFQTNDPSIYAAGPATRYFRRYLADNCIPKLYSSREIGQRLGEQIKNQLDPLFTECDKGDQDDAMTCQSGIFASPSLNIIRNPSISACDEGNYKLKTPKFVKPKVVYCILPCQLQYLDVRPPGPHLPHYYVRSLEYTGCIIETFKSGYFKLHLDKYYVVDGLSCLTPNTTSIQNFKNLYGISALVLNNVHLRYNAGQIEDLFEFFRAPWSGFLYTDRSEELLTVVRHLKPKNKHFGETMEQMLHKYSTDSSSFSEEARMKTKKDIRHLFEQAGYFEAIADYVIEWITENDLLFPMYITPSRLTEFTSNNIRPPAFRRRRQSIKKLLASST